MDDRSKLMAYYARYNISLDDLERNVAEPYRFIRLHPVFDAGETLQQLKEELEQSQRKLYPVQVPWLDPAFGFYALPGDFRLSHSPSFQSGRIYGQDVSSGAAVAALLSDYHHRDKTQTETRPSVEPITGWRVLDLCCAPGLKLCAIADWLRQQQAIHTVPCSSDKNSLVVGVDISGNRLAACQKIVQKHQIEPFVDSDSSSKCSVTFAVPSIGEVVRIRLYQKDGTKFGTEPAELVFDSTLAFEERLQLGKRKKLNKSARARQKRKLKEMSIHNMQGHATASEKDGGDKPEMEQFDRVLVDAECSTDGSLKHVKKRIASSRIGDAVRTADVLLEVPSSFTIPQLATERRLADLVRLQRGLAEAGFRLLKKGGFMVYSTCSFSDQQNEEVVQWLLEKYESVAKIVPLKFASGCSTGSGEENLVKEGSIPGTVRFFPSFGKQDNAPLTGGGFFLAKIQKLS